MCIKYEQGKVCYFNTDKFLKYLFKNNKYTFHYSNSCKLSNIVHERKNSNLERNNSILLHFIMNFTEPELMFGCVNINQLYFPMSSSHC